MGSFLATLMNQRNALSIVPHPTMEKERVQGGPVPDTETSTASAIYRHIDYVEEEKYQKLVADFIAGKNCVQKLEERCRESGSRPALAYRPVEKVERRAVCDASGKERLLDYTHYGERKNFSYTELWQSITSFGAGLRDLGVGERETVTIYEETRWEWLVSIYGIWTQNMIASTVYANLGEDALACALSETKSSTIICNGQSLKTLIPLLRVHNLQPIVVYTDSIPSGVDTEGYRLIQWKDVLERGAAEKYAVNIPTDNNIEALIMYTSGTTGNPKGVTHTHGSVAAGVQALGERLSDLYKQRGENEVYCAFLPLAHILEFGIVNIFLQRGSLVGFCNPRTLTDNFAIPHGDFKEFSPSIVIGVPRIFDTIKKAVEAQLPPLGSFKRAIFEKAYASRLQSLKKGNDTPYWNEKVFSSVRAILGGKTFSMLSGGAPLNNQTQEFVNVCFGGPLLIQGWGLTETVCCGATQRLNFLGDGDVGQPLLTVEMRLLDVDEYKHTDKPEPRGEILLRGPFLFKGYYKQEKLTREAIDEDGWFHTGDIGSIISNGRLRIIGRVKALAKNVLGEYIALEALESMYAQNDLSVVGGVCVVVNPEKSYIAAILLTDSERALKFAAVNGLSGSFEELLENEAFHTAAAVSLAATAKKARRRPFEIVKYVRVVNDVWTPENGLVTPTAKLRRGNVEKHYSKLISRLFEKE